MYGLHWIAVSLECEGRALADEELAVATLAARAMAAIKEKIGRMEFFSDSFEPDIDVHVLSACRGFNTSVGLPYLLHAASRHRSIKFL